MRVPLLDVGLLVAGLLVGAYLARPEPEVSPPPTTTPEEAARLWRSFLAYRNHVVVCEGDLAPHPGMVAASLAAVGGGIVASATRRRRKSFGRDRL